MKAQESAVSNQQSAVREAELGHNPPCPELCSQAPDLEDPRVIAAVQEYLTALECGDKLSRSEFLQRHAEIAGALAICLAGLEFVHKAASGLHSSALHPPVAASGGDAEAVVGTPLGDFRILREIGRGGMGIVYEAEQLSLGRRVALKILPFAAALDPKQLQRFRIEAQAAAHLHHTHIVPVHAVGCERGVHFYAMQYIEGQTVAALIRQLRQLAGLDTPGGSVAAAPASALASELLSGYWAPAKRGPAGDVGSAQTTTPPAAAISTQRSTTSPAFFRTVAHLGVQAAEALEHAHAKGIIHRDIKPANLLLDVEGSLWITDFGLARMVSEAGLTMTGDLVGTLRYMSPEQALAKREPADHRTDIYSLGVTLYELLTLRPAYDGRDRQEILRQIAFEEARLPRRLNKSIPTELETIIRKAIAKSPAERYGTAQELADDLLRFLDDKPIRAKKPTVLDWTRKWVRRHPGVVATGVGGLLIAVLILSVSMLQILSANRVAQTNLYLSRVGQASALRQARGTGYRRQVWKLLQEAVQLDTPAKNWMELREEAVACMGDFAGLERIAWSGFSGDINAIALHPNGQSLAIGLDDGRVVLGDVRSAKATAQLKQHGSPVAALAFTADGARLVSGDLNARIHIWEARADGEWALARTIIAQPRLIGFIPSPGFPFFVPYFVIPTLDSYRTPNSIAISPDSKQLAACLFYDIPGYYPSGCTLARWNLANEIRDPPFLSERVLPWSRSPAFSPDGKLLSACYLRHTGDGPVRQAQQGVLLLDQDGTSAPRELPINIGFVHQARFSPDGKLLACACDEGLALFDTTSFECQRFAQVDRAHSVAFSPDSHLLAIANPLLGQVHLWKVTNHRELAILRLPGGLMEGVHSVACSRDVLVAASKRGVHQWNLADCGEKLRLAGHVKGTNSIAFAPDGKLLASAGKDRSVNIWDAATGQLLKHLPPFGAEVDTLAISADGKMLATGDWAGHILIWDVASGTQLAPVPDHGLGVNIWSVGFSPDGRYFAASACDHGFTLWRIQAGGTNEEPRGLKLQRILAPADSGVPCLAFSPDSRLLAWVDLDRNTAVHLWDLEESRERFLLPVRLALGFRCLAFHPGGKQLMFVTDTGVAEAWDVTTGSKAFPFTGQDSKEDSEDGRLLNVIALNSDGSRLAGICGSGRNVAIWDTASRSRLLKLPEEQSAIACLAWNPQRESLAVGTTDGSLAIWDLNKIKAQLDEIGLGW